MEELTLVVLMHVVLAPNKVRSADVSAAAHEFNKTGIGQWAEDHGIDVFPRYVLEHYPRQIKIDFTAALTPVQQTEFYLKWQT